MDVVGNSHRKALGANKTEVKHEDDQLIHKSQEESNFRILHLKPFRYLNWGLTAYKANFEFLISVLKTALEFRDASISF